LWLQVGQQEPSTCLHKLGNKQLACAACPEVNKE